MSIFENRALKILEAEAFLCEETATEEPENDTKTVITMPENTTKKERKNDSYCAKVARYQTEVNLNRTLAEFVRFQKLSLTYAEKARQRKHEYRAQMMAISRLNEIENYNVFGVIL